MEIVCSLEVTDLIEGVLDGRYPVDRVNIEGVNAFVMACCVGNVEAIKTMISRGICVDMQNKNNGNNGLFMASAYGHQNVVGILISAKTDLNIKNFEGVTALGIASCQGHIEVVRMLIDARADLDADDNCGDTPLAIAIGKKRTEIAQILIRAGCQIGLIYVRGSTNLISIRPSGEQIVEKIKYYSYIILATLYGNVEIVRMLVDRGCALNIQNDRSNTALMFASRCGYTDIVKILVCGKCALDVLNEDQSTALIMALKNENTEIANILIGAGCDINLKDYYGLTAIYLASFYGFVEMVRRLIERGCHSFDVRAFDECTPIMSASMNGHTEIVRMLVSAGCALDYKDRNGRTALDIAIAKGHQEIIDLLMATKKK